MSKIGKDYTLPGPSKVPPKAKPHCNTRVHHSGDTDARDEVPEQTHSYSAAKEMLFRVMRQSAKRLSKESAELGSVQDLLTQSLEDCKKEMDIVQSMLDLAKRSFQFQKTGKDPDSDQEDEETSESEVGNNTMELGNHGQSVEVNSTFEDLREELLKDLKEELLRDWETETEPESGATLDQYKNESDDVAAGDQEMAMVD